MRTDFGYFEEKQLGKPYDLKLLRRLYPFVRPFMLFLWVSIVLVVLITLLDLALPYVTKIAIDRHIVPQMKPVAARKAAAGGAGGRYLQADLNDPRVEAVVRQHPDLFKRYGTLALIRHEDFQTLAGAERTDLRRTDLAGLGRVTLFFLALIIINFGLNFVQVMLMEYTGQRIMHHLRLRLYSHMQSLAVSFFNRHPVGRLVTRATNDIQNMHELFTSVIAFIFKDLFLLLGIAAVLLSIDWQLALVSFTVLPLVVLGSLYFAGQAREAFRTLRIKLADINTRFSETIGGLTVIQLFLNEKENLDRFSYLNHEHYLAGMRQVHVFAVFMPVIELLGALAIAIVIYYGGGSILESRISLGALVVFLSYMRMFFRPIRDIAEKYNILQNAMASAERIFLILDSTEQLPQPAAASPLAAGSLPEPSAARLDHLGAIGLDQVSFAYAQGENVLKEVSFTVRAGETVALVGPTGSGKTTIINLLIRFHMPTTGRVLINGRDLNEFDIGSVRAKMALVTQDPFLFSESVRNNITYGNADLSPDTLRQVLEASKCTSLVERLPQGADTVLAEGGMSISSGERQLLSIARAFARDPDLIILDEATSYIDSATEQKIQAALSNLMAGRTSIIVAHRLATARQADRIIVLNRGRIIETGSHAELMQRQGFYFRLNQLDTRP